MKKIPTAPTAKFRQGHIDLPIFMDIVKRMPPHSQAGAWVLLLTGLRSGTEYMALGVEHLDHHGHYVSVPGTKTDGSMDRVYVPPSYWSWVVAGTPAPVRYKWLASHFKRAARAAGDPKLSLAHLRNLHGILPLDRGANVSDVQRSMRHTTPSMTLRYTTQQSKGRVAAVIGDALSEAGAEPLLAMPGPWPLLSRKRRPTLPAWRPIGRPRLSVPQPTHQAAQAGPRARCTRPIWKASSDAKPGV